MEEGSEEGKPRRPRAHGLVGSSCLSLTLPRWFDPRRRSSRLRSDPHPVAAAAGAAVAHPAVLAEPVVVVVVPDPDPGLVVFGVDGVVVRHPGEDG